MGHFCRCDSVEEKWRLLGLCSTSRMTRSDLIDRVAQMGRMSRPRAEMLIGTIFDSLEQSLRRGEKIEVRGFGTFQVRPYQPYDADTPASNATRNHQRRPNGIRRPGPCTRRDAAKAAASCTTRLLPATLDRHCGFDQRMA